MLKLFKEQNNHLYYCFELKDFKEAIFYINEISKISERLNHHPEIHLHDYNKLSISLKTHLTGGITERDVELGKKIERLYLASK